MKEKRIEKEIKKAQKKGIYNPKLKLGIVGLILVIGTVIGVSYAYYTDKSTTVLTISGTVSKKIKVTVTSSGNGTVSSSPKTVDYGTQAAFTMSPNAGYQYKNISCDNNSNISHSGNTLYITPKTSKDVTCTVTFGEETVKIFNHEYKIKQGDPNFSKGCPTKGDTDCSGVYKMTDYNDINNLNTKTGTSYYFRGAVENNYVQFGKGKTSDNSTQHDLLWRIVRINGDGSIRLVLDGDIGESKFNNIDSASSVNKYVGYTYDNGTPCTNSNPCQSYNVATTNEDARGETYHGGENSTIKKYLEDWYYDNLKSYDQYIAYGIYCNDTSYGSESEDGYFSYGPYQRLLKNTSPQLTCPDPTADSNENESVTTVNNIKYHTYGGVYKLKIGLLSADEIVLAGFKLLNGGVTESNYLYYSNRSSNWFWSASPSDKANGFFVNLYDRYLSVDSVNLTFTVRPVINLSTVGLTATGEGTAEKPFVVKTN